MNTANRREFLTRSGALALTGAASIAAPSAVNRIDCQSHVFLPELVAVMEKRKASPYMYRKDGGAYIVVNDWTRRLMPKHMDVDAKLADMDASGIQMAALSINDPGPELFGADGPAIGRLANDGIAEITRKHPSRFFGLMVLPLQDVDASLREMERCTNKLGMKGILLYSNINGEFPDEEQFRPVFAQAERMGLPILLHPAYPMTYEITKGREMATMLGLMFDTTIALGRMILAGMLDQYPRLKLVCPHVGGALPFLVGRMDHQTMVLKRGAENIRKAPSEYLKQVWFDAVSPISLAVKYGIDFAGPDKMLFSTDHPWVEPKIILDTIRELHLAPDVEAKVMSGNARALFNL
ncbi:MAG: amidohydrolase family protein [Bryobacterales bacterium]|nr:amidohydrolase family protein [Bryobacterales bacterium]